MSTPLEVFCCYAREDQEMLLELKKHLMPFQRQGQITIWSDTNINAGVEWEKELHNHLDSADIILLLISPDFMASDYCYSTEMMRAIERHDQGSAQVIPILLRSTFWQNAPFAKLQMIPTNAEPVTNWPSRNRAFLDITEQIYRVIIRLSPDKADKHSKPDRIGQQIGNYRLISLLGSGGFAEVYLGEHIHIELQVAIKVLHTQISQNYQAEFRQEANTIARLRHPHIIRLLDFGVESRDLAPYLIMDYARHGTLRDRHPKGSIVPLETVIPYMQQIAQALQYAHDQNLIHRDLKPENLLVGDNDEILLSDFGIAALAHSTSSVQTETYAGSIPYSAPEQILGKPRRESDQYALGIILYEWLTGSRPFQGTMAEIVSQHLGASPNPMQEKGPGIPPRVETVIMSALAKDPHQRFESIQAFADALEQAFTSSPVAPEMWSVPLPTQADQPATMKTESSATSSSNATVLAEVPATSRPLMPAPVSHLAWYRRSPDKRVLFIFTALLLIALSGSGLYYFGFVARTQPLSPAQATATAAAQAYATATAKQGVMFGFDAAHTRNNPYEHLLSPANISRLTSLWSFSTGSPIFSSPAVADGLVYVGSADGRLYAFDAACRNACQPLWSFLTGAKVNSSPAVAGGMVYVGSADHNLYAFDATCRNACQPLWSFATGNLIDASEPTVAGGMVYVGSDDHNLYAFAATCRNACQPLWSFATGDLVRSSPAVAGGVVYVGSWDGKLYAFDATCRTACQPLWSFDTGSHIHSSPAVAGGVVYVGSWDGKLYAFDATCRSACQPLWSFAAGDTIFSSPAVAGGMVYVGSYDSKLYAFDATCRSACQPLWSFATGGSIVSSPAVAGGMVYITSADGSISVFDATCRSSCQLLRSFVVGGPIWSSPVVANGMIYVGSNDNKLYALGLVA